MRYAIFCCLLLAAAAVAAIERPLSRTIAGPASPEAQPSWLAAQKAWRATTLQSVNYSGSIYANFLPWSSSLFIVPQSHIYDRFLYDPVAAKWTPDSFIDDVTARYGGIDGVLLWGTYPNIGVDERSQFDIIQYDLPGGLPAFAALVAAFSARGIKVGLPYNPWDTGTARRNASDEVVTAALTTAIGAVFVNGDTMTLMDPSFWSESVKAGNPLALQPEGGPVLESLAYTKMGWGYWPAPYIPDIDTWKWLERRHITQICNRWAVDHTNDLQQAFFNGDGFVSWESVWGSWNGLSARDAEATRRVGALLRFLGTPFFTSEDWEPHTVLVRESAAAGLFASLWPAAAEAGVPFAATNASAWTLVNRGAADISMPSIKVLCSGAVVYFDLYHGTALSPQHLRDGGCALKLNVEALGFGAVLGLAVSDAPGGTPPAAVAAFLSKMAAMTAAPLASFSRNATLLQQVQTPHTATPVPPTTPPGSTLIAGATAWPFTVMGTEIEGRQNLGNDVQFSWETIAVTEHATHAVDVPNLYWDTTPVTNAAYAAFLASSAYAPTDSHNFLLDWAGARTPPAGAEDKPVTWVDLIDARAYCAHYGKRLPEDWEWQYAGQSGVPGRMYPWGDEYDDSAVPSKETGTARPLPPDVGLFPRGDTTSGLKDMMGLVWQWTSEFTDAHTRAGLVRGGSYYTSMGCFSASSSGCTNTSGWYFPNQLAGNPINHGTGVHLMSHGKLLLMAPAYDRHGTVGFRCIADGPPLPRT